MKLMIQKLNIESNVTTRRNYMDLFKRIQNQYDSMSDNKKQISKYFMDEWMDVAFSTTREIAKKLDVSEALVVRLSMELGYSGFKELQNSLRDLMRVKLGRLDRIKDFQDGDPKEFASKVFEIEHQNLSHTFEVNTESSIERAVALLINARRIFTVGDRNAGAIAILAAIDLNEVLNNAMPLVAMYGTADDYLRDADSRDCMLAVSLPKYSNYTLRLVQLAQSKGVPVIAITDSTLSDLVRFSEVVLLVACDTLAFNLSHVGTIALLNTLIAHIVAENRETSIENISDIEGITSERLDRLKE